MTKETNNYYPSELELPSPKKYRRNEFDNYVPRSQQADHQVSSNKPEIRAHSPKYTHEQIIRHRRIGAGILSVAAAGSIFLAVHFAGSGEVRALAGEADVSKPTSVEGLADSNLKEQDSLENFTLNGKEYKYTEQRSDESQNGISDSTDLLSDSGSEVLLEEGGWIKQTEILPIFSEGVYEHADIIKKIADRYEIPVNFLAAICDIESGGKADAQSGAGALGAFQIMPGYHSDAMGKVGGFPETFCNEDYLRAKKGEKSNHSLEFYRQAYFNPELSAVLSGQILNGLKKSIDKKFPNFSDYESWKLVADCYNGGLGKANVEKYDFSGWPEVPPADWPEETQGYDKKLDKRIDKMNESIKLYNQGLSFQEVRDVIGK